MDNFYDRLYLFLSEIRDVLTYILVGGFGGIAYSILTSKEFTVGNLSRCVVVSAFSGFLAGIGCTFLGVPDKAALFCSGVFGFAGGFGLLVMMTKITKIAGISNEEIQSSMERLQFYEYNIAGKALSRLTEEKLLDADDCNELSKGNYVMLLKLLKAKKLSGKEFDALRQWFEEISGGKDDMEDQ